MSVLQCKFKMNVSAIVVRSQPSKNSPVTGYLFKNSCPDNLHYFCNADLGSGEYYVLLDPDRYSLSATPVKYVSVSYDHLDWWKVISNSEYELVKSGYLSPSQTTGTTIAQPNVTPSSPNISSSPYSNTNGVIKNSQAISTSDNIDRYLSYTGKTENALTPVGEFQEYNKHIENYYMRYDSLINDIKIAKNNLNIGNINPDLIKNNTLTKFNRFKIAYPETVLTKTFAYLFFTRPDLNLFSDKNTLIPKVSNDPFYYYMFKNNKDLLLSLTGRNFSYAHDFNPFLSNKAGSFELKDEYVDTDEYGETFTGWKIKYGKNNVKSKSADAFSITYTDDNNYNIYKIHKAWVDYISKVYRGEFSPTRSNIINRTIDYACSVYYFLCGADGETILFWTKYTGVFPTTIPSSRSSWDGGVGKAPEYNINYEYSWKEDMMPTSLAEFNKNSERETSTKYAKIYDYDLGSTGKTFVGTPFVETIDDVHNNTYLYKLRFRTE